MLKGRQKYSWLAASKGINLLFGAYACFFYLDRGRRKQGQISLNRAAPNEGVAERGPTSYKWHLLKLLRCCSLQRVNDEAGV